MAVEPALSTVSSVVCLMDNLLSLLRNITGRRMPTAPAEGAPALARFFLKRERPLDFELIPMSFEITTNTALPSIGVWLQAVNYLSRDLTVASLQVGQFQLSGCPVFETISTTLGIVLPARRSRQLLCRRNLSDAEIRSLAGAHRSDRYNAFVTVSGSYSVKAKLYQYGPYHTLGVNGWLDGIPVIPVAGALQQITSNP